MEFNQINLRILPAFIHESTITVGFPQKYVFFEERYLALIELVMRGSGTFCITSVFDTPPYFADMVKIRSISDAFY